MWPAPEEVLFECQPAVPVRVHELKCTLVAAHGVLGLAELLRDVSEVLP
jgi:hypothetical protein